MPPRRFPPPWSIEDRQESFIVKDANGQQLASVYFENEPQRQMSMKRRWTPEIKGNCVAIMSCAWSCQSASYCPAEHAAGSI
jgi:hypothetical protein